MKITVITIGDELLVGQVIDTNSSTIAKLLYPLGFQVFRKYTVADQKSEIMYAMKEAEKSSDLVLITGGLGPTKDDITKKAMAEFFDKALIFSQEAYTHLEKILLPRKIPITEIQKTQCFIPENANVLNNEMGTALGIKIVEKNTTWISMPGVPYEMEFIMKHAVIPLLLKENSTLQYKLTHETIHFCGLGETEIAERLEPLLENIKDEISLAYLPSIGIVKLRISNTINSKVGSMQKAMEIIQHEFKHKIFGIGETDLAKEIGKKLITNKLQIGTAESCTGGAIAQKITNNSGASAYYKGSIVSYANEIKTNSLGVAPEVLFQFGAVSEECLKQMILGACNQLNTDIVIASTGIAGPDGGSSDKPVGTVWLGVGNANMMKTKQMRFSRDRIRNIEASAIWGLILLWEYLYEM